MASPLSSSIGRAIRKKKEKLLCCFKICLVDGYFLINVPLLSHPVAARLTAGFTSFADNGTTCLQVELSPERLIIPTAEISLLPTPCAHAQPGRVRWGVSEAGRQDSSMCGANFAIRERK